MSRTTDKNQHRYILSKLDSLTYLDSWQNYAKKEGLTQKNGFFHLTEKIHKKMTKVKTDSLESNIYRLDNFILKIPKSGQYHHNLIRSYYIGMILNNLRCIIPNFVSTLGIFSYNKQVIVAQEYVQGETLENLIVKKVINFQEFLNIFIQILFALEIAQRQYRFCHYDLHLKNIIMKPMSKPYKYTVVVDTKKYELNAEKYIPIILDFGLASINVENKTIGSYNYQSYGVMPYLIQGVDMYKFLFHAYAKSGHMFSEIASLFLFYGSYDPYKLLLTSTDKIPEISKSYLKKASFSRAATYTPYELFLWIKNFPDYKITVIESDRDIYLPLQIQCNFTSKTNSYIMNKYIEKISREPRETTEKMIEDDIDILMQYKSIKLPDEIVCKDTIAETLNTYIGKTGIKLDSNFITEIKPYLQFLYTIRELQLETSYKNFVYDFLNSSQYKIYNRLSFDMEKASRWNKTLFEAEKNLKNI